MTLGIQINLRIPQLILGIYTSMFLLYFILLSTYYICQKAWTISLTPLIESIAYLILDTWQYNLPYGFQIAHILQHSSHHESCIYLHNLCRCLRCSPTTEETKDTIINASDLLIWLNNNIKYLWLVSNINRSSFNK